jgi:hypothetical protein
MSKITLDKRVLKTLREQPCADLCLNCGEFVTSTLSHCSGTFKDHVVVRATKQPF